MQLTNQDIAVIENALRQVMNQGADYRDMIQCREVLTKLQNMSMLGTEGSYLSANEEAMTDGIRYDYDDHAGG